MIEKTGRILVVEDDLDIRSILTQLLVFEGYDVEEAADGAEALALLRRDAPPALILLDLMMPVMDGWQLRAELQRDPALASIPVVIVSADVRVEQEASRLRVAGLLKKPLQIEPLLELVHRICGAPAS
ncbi:MULTISPECIES: response regulator [Sorangium]|uniref:Response regulator n=2 Tax=Sorangium TaxID=39643 RepID=A9F147_SORC5|nr:response regulator [Sorangium cellulosum]CAN91331.1 response regulator [Sorangium cellulosum So ce56]